MTRRETNNNAHSNNHAMVRKDRRTAKVEEIAKVLAHFPGTTADAAAHLLGITNAQKFVQQHADAITIAAFEKRLELERQFPDSATPGDPTIADPREVMQFLTGVMRGEEDGDPDDPRVTMTEKLRSADMLLKAHGAYQVDINVKGTVTGTVNHVHERVLAYATTEELERLEETLASAARRSGMLPSKAASEFVEADLVDDV